MIIRVIVSLITVLVFCISMSYVAKPPEKECGENSILNTETQECDCIDCYKKDELGNCTLCTDACESMYYGGKQLCVSKVPQTQSLDNVDNVDLKPFEVKNEQYTDLGQGAALEDIKLSNDVAEINFNKITPYFKNDTGEIPRLSRSLIPKHSKDYENDWQPSPEDTTKTGLNNYGASSNLAYNSLGLKKDQMDMQLTRYANGDIMDEYQPMTSLHRPYNHKPLEVWDTHYEKENTRVLNGRNEVPGPYATPIINADQKLSNLEFSKPIIAGSTIPEPNNNRNKINTRVNTNNDLREHAQTYMGHAYVEASGDDIRRQVERKDIREKIRPSLKGAREAGKIVEPYILNQDFRNLETLNLTAKQDPPNSRYPLVNDNNEAKPYHSLRDVNNYQTIHNRDFSQLRQPHTNNSGGLLSSYNNTSSLHENINEALSSKLRYTTNNFDMLSTDYYAERNNNLRVGLPNVMAK